MLLGAHQVVVATGSDPLANVANREIAEEATRQSKAGRSGPFELGGRVRRLRLAVRAAKMLRATVSGLAGVRPAVFLVSQARSD